MSFASLSTGQRLDLKLDAGSGILKLDVMVNYTYHYGNLSREISKFFNFTDSDNGQTITIIKEPPVRSTQRKEIENIIFRNLGTAKPIVTLTIVEPVDGQPDKTFILHAQDLKEVMPLYDLAGQFAEYANS